MGSPCQAIESAFAERLTQYTALNDIQVAWPNVSCRPVIGTAYLRVDHSPGEPLQAEIGPEGRNVHVGFYQITLVYPAGTGTLGAGTIRDEIVDHFKRGTVLSSDGVSLTITRAFPGSMMTDPDWVRIPITLRYRVFAAN